MFISYPNYKFLVVDNFSTIMTIVRHNLQNLGYPRVDSAKNGQDVLSKLRLSKYDLVIADLNLSDMSGLDLLERIKEEYEIRQTPVLLMATAISKEQALEAAYLGAVGCLIKPFKTKDFDEKIIKIMQRYRLPA